MTPTSLQFNPALWELFGYAEDPNGYFGEWMTPDGPNEPSPPDFCFDREALPILWEFMRKSGKIPSFLKELKSLLHLCKYDIMYGCNAKEVDTWMLHTATPEIQAMAALKACNAWKDDWKLNEANK